MEIIPHYRVLYLFSELSSHVWMTAIHDSGVGCPIYWTCFYSLFILKKKKNKKKNIYRRLQK